MTALQKLSHLIVHRARVILAAALVAIVGGLALAPLFESKLLGLAYHVPGSESARATEVIAEATGYTERDLLVVSSDRFRFDDAEFKAALGDSIAAIEGVDDEVLVLPPGTEGGGEVSANGRAATAAVAITGDVAHRQELTTEMQDEIEEAVTDDFEAGITGSSPVIADLLHTEEEDLIKAEVVGLPIALFLLLLAFGTVVAAGLPLMMAIGGLLASIGAVALLMFVMDFNSFAETFMVMFGLALGIDYSLLFVRRFREERARRGTNVQIVERTLRTAGRTIVFSGAIFSAALLPVVVTGLPFFSDTLLAVIVVVAVEVTLLLTLLPAVLVKLGDRLDSGRLPGPFGRGRLGAESRAWRGWAHRVMARPITALFLGSAVLLAAAVPLLGLKTGIDLNVRAMEQRESVKPIAKLQEHFGAAAVAPVEVLVRAEPDQLAGSTDFVAATMADQQLDEVRSMPLGPDATLLLGMPTAAIDSADTFEQIGHLRAALDRSLPAGEALVTGVTAETVDYSEKTEDVTPWVIAAALAFSFVLLMWLFRSPVLAAKAIVMNLLAIGAALGLTVLLFQEGLAEGLFAFESPGYIQTWTPLTMFVMLFGLSMDYEVFMVSRIREEYDRVGDTREAVALGLARTGTVVTYAALIMIVIFASFILSTIPEMKQMGFGLAIAVLIDATVVRTVLVPAFMCIAGKWNWWMPQRLDRLLPELKH